MTLTETASAIRAHLDRFAADPKIAEKDWVDHIGRTRKLSLFWYPTSRRGGSRVMIKYVSYQYESSLTHAEAERYLAWLNAGNVGRHYDVPKED